MCAYKSANKRKFSNLYSHILIVFSLTINPIQNNSINCHKMHLTRMHSHSYLNYTFINASLKALKNFKTDKNVVSLELIDFFFHCGSSQLYVFKIHWNKSSLERRSNKKIKCLQIVLFNTKFYNIELRVINNRELNK